METNTKNKTNAGRGWRLAICGKAGVVIYTIANSDTANKGNEKVIKKAEEKQAVEC